MARLAAVPERRAAFREEKRLPALDVPLESTGRLFYRRPDYLEKVTDWPQPERLVVDGDRVIITAGNDAPNVVPLGRVPELRALVDALRAPLAGDLAALQRSFTVTASGTASAWRIDLVPRDPRATRVIRSVRIAGVGDEPREILVIGGEGDEDRLRIEPRS